MRLPMDLLIVEMVWMNSASLHFLQ
jgi:hypothetical protein